MRGVEGIKVRKGSRVRKAKEERKEEGEREKGDVSERDMAQKFGAASDGTPARK